jgi:hypothetical protein
MTTKDYVYLGLMVLAAVVFYVHGFCAGAEQARQAFTNYLKRPSAASAATASSAPTPAVASCAPSPSASLASMERQVSSAAPVVSGRRNGTWGSRDIHPRIEGDFSNN